MSNALFILGAPDDEMTAIQEILEALEVPYMLALDEHGKRVSPRSTNLVSISNQNKVCTGKDFSIMTSDVLVDLYKHIFWVECLPIQLHDQWWINNTGDQKHISHHSPGDGGYGVPPELYWDASSIGRVISYLQCPPRGTRIVPKNIVDVNAVIQPKRWLLEHIAAADHCLREAYKGRCPGILPISMRMWRLMSSAKQRNLSVDYCVRHQQEQIAELLALPNFSLGANPDTVSELETYQLKDATEMNIYNAPELAYITGMVIMYKQRNRICITNADPWVVDLWMERYAHVNLTDFYANRIGGSASGKIVEHRRPG